MRSGSNGRSRPAIFSGNIATRILVPEFITPHVSTGILFITTKIARPESTHENRTRTKTSTIAASIGERFHQLPHPVALNQSQYIDLYAKY